MATIKQVTTSAKLLEGMQLEVKAGRHTLYVDQPVSGGGTDTGPTPLEYLQFALAGCLGTIARIVARQQKINLRGFNVVVEGALDLDVLMGKSTDNRSGFIGLKAVVDIDADLTHAEKIAFLEEVDRRCPISDNLHAGTPIQLFVEEPLTIHNN
jgi:uncharacterized OsmC-like protein